MYVTHYSTKFDEYETSCLLFDSCQQRWAA